VLLNRPGVLLLDSIGYVSETQGPGVVIVSGSHGGTSAARYVLALPRMPQAVFFNDAGVGKDGAGIAGLPMLDERGVPCATYSHASARIGDAADGLEHGRITYANEAAQRLGVAPGQPVADAIDRICAR
jgi:hypothetical protein